MRSSLYDIVGEGRNNPLAAHLAEFLPLRDIHGYIGTEILIRIVILLK